MKINIGYRTIKTAIATPLSLGLAQLIGVTNISTAGIITMLCIQSSRKKSFVTAIHRFLACLLAILFSFIFFTTLGYSAFVLSLLLIVFIPSAIFFKIEQGIMTSTVITLNMYTFGDINTEFMYNQLLLIVIGISVGLVVNLYMPSLDGKLKHLQQEVENKFKHILLEISFFVKEGSMDWDGKEITELEYLFEEAAKLTERDKENHLLRSKHSYFNYFEMRKKQFVVLQRMLPLVARLPKKIDVQSDISYFFEKLSEAVHPGDTATLFLSDLQKLHKKIKESDLPNTQEEFETRSSLLQLLYELEIYLNLKSNFKKGNIKYKKIHSNLYRKN